MNTPRTAQVFNKGDYWAAVVACRTARGLPTWTFDFISVHSPDPFLRSYKGRRGYSLCSPMPIIDLLGHRPTWEENLYPTKRQALRIARELCRTFSKSCRRRFHVVTCLDPDVSDNVERFPNLSAWPKPIQALA